MRRFLRNFGMFVLGLVLGIAIGLAAGLITFPYVFAPPPATEQRSELDVTPVAAGSFIHVDTSDPVHWGKGRVSVFKRAVFLEPDFEVGPGPAYHVYLAVTPAIRRDDNATYGEVIDLGRLRSFGGSQRYPIPDGVDVSKYASVIIWCKAFGVLISPADLQAPSS
jgi:hypothetical protein